MLLIAASLCLGILPLVSGLTTIGNGHYFQFHKSDVMRGRRDAWCYIWVLMTMFIALASTASVVDYAAGHHWQIYGPDIPRWFCIRALGGTMLMMVHVFIRQDIKSGLYAHTYLWGAGARV